MNRELEEFRLTGGIIFDEVLEAYPIDTDGDKIILPVSALERCVCVVCRSKTTTTTTTTTNDKDKRQRQRQILRVKGLRVRVKD